MPQNDVSSESQALITQAEALIEQVEKRRGAIDKLYAQYGSTRDDMEKITEAGMAALTPEQKAEIERDENEWRREIEEILQSTGSPGKPKVHPGLLRI